MRFAPPLCTALFFALFSSAFAQTPDDGVLHILRPALHAEQDKAELCLEFDRPLENAGSDNDFAKAASAIHLVSAGKTIALAPQNFNLTGNTACISNLEHRKSYRLTVGDLRGDKGEKLGEAYHLSFTVPDRAPSLAFLSDLYGGGMLRWQDNDPTLRGVNVTRVKIELYRVTDMGAMQNGWQQRLQTTLAPTESAYFARNNGTLVWKGDIVLDNAPNQAIEQKVPLRAALSPTLGNVPNGFYLVVASAILPQGVDKKALAPIAASWLLRSDLRLHIMRGGDGVYAFAEKADASGLFPAVHLTLLGKDNAVLAEDVMDAAGVAHLEVAAKMGDASVLMGVSNSGDVDFADLAPTADNDFLIDELTFVVMPTKTVYAPGDSVETVLAAHDMHGATVAVRDTRLLLLRGNRAFYALYPAPKDDNGFIRITVPAPPENGNWILLWQKNNGQNLAETPFRVTSNEIAPQFRMETDRSMIGEDGTLDIAIKSVTADGSTAPYLPGRLIAGWVAVDRIFPGYDGYRFGDGSIDAKPSTNVPFLSDANGVAHIHLHLDPPAGNGLYAALVTLQSDPAAGAADPAPIRVPLRPRGVIIGVKPLATDAHFPENGIAQFDVVALDPDGKRVADDDLHDQIFEEGRSFDWKQAEGKWDYSLEPQRRRAGGGALSLRAEGQNIVDWPVTAGNYSLEIAGAKNVPLTRIAFASGWDPSKIAPSFAPLALIIPPELAAGEVAKVRFRLDAPAIVTAAVADDHIRKVWHEMRAAGDNDITFVPDASWGNRVAVRIEARSLSDDGTLQRSAGKVTLSLRHMGKNRSAVTQALPAIDIVTPPLPVLQAGDNFRFAVEIRNDGATTNTYHVAFAAGEGLKATGAVKSDVKIAAGQKTALIFPVTVLSPGAREIKMEVSGHGIRETRGWILPVAGGTTALRVALAQTVQPQQVLMLPEDKNSSGAFVFAASAPLFGLPQILAKIPHTHPFTTPEIAGVMDALRLWRKTLMEAGLVPDIVIAAKERGFISSLLRRQKDDGGFPRLPGGDGDIIATSKALQALAASGDPATTPAIDRAADWLKQKLGNNWFDESERPARAAAYAALASVRRLDAASLQHFSDDSAQKDMQPLASAQIAYAFAKNNEPPKAAFWLGKIGDIRQAAEAEPALLPVLIANDGVDQASLLPALEKLSGAAENDPRTAADFLIAMYDLQSRASAWKLSLGRGDQSLQGVFAMKRDEKTALALRNPGDRVIYVAMATGSDDQPPPFVRNIYAPGGQKIAPPELKRGETYLVVVEGNLPNNTGGDTLLHDHPGPALAPASCALEDAMRQSEALGWMRDLPLSPIAACDKSDYAVDILFSPRGENARGVRAAYLARAAWDGNFKTSSPRLRFLTKND